MDRFKHIDTWVFDLDNTLYDAETGVFVRVGDRMTDFITNLLKVSREEANALRKKYWTQYGTSLRGLMLEHAINPGQFLEHVHDVHIDDVPQCLITKEYLEHLPGKKIIFTNAPRAFAVRMTKHLGIEHHFDHLFAIEDANYMPKPHVDPYHAIIKNFQFDPKKACMFEDMEVNLKTAAELGMTTVWFHGKHQTPCEGDHPHVHHKAEKLADWLQHTIRKK